MDADLGDRGGCCGPSTPRGAESGFIELPNAVGRAPCPGIQSLGDLLQSFQPYLLSIARRDLPDGVRAKYDPADLVLETLLKPHRDLVGYNGPDSDAFRVWLCGILRHNLLDLIRRYRDVAERSIGRERSLAAGPGSDDPAVEVVDLYPTPYAQSIAREEIAALREALSRLPEHERSVIALRFFDLLPFEEIGHRLGCSSHPAPGDPGPPGLTRASLR